MDSVLELRDVETCYGLSQVLFGVSLAIAPGEMVTLMGRNGMGKTTTVRSIMGLTPARSGVIRFAGSEIRGQPSYKVAKLGIGLVPEGPADFPEPERARESGRDRGQRGTARTGRWTRSTRCFRGCPSATPAWAISFPAASSRCWRSAAR